MKTEIDIHDDLLAQATRHAERLGLPLSAVIEDGIRRVLSDRPSADYYSPPDMSVGDPDDPDPLKAYSWPELRDMIYGDSVTP